jgi:hypothetical protein
LSPGFLLKSSDDELAAKSLKIEGPLKLLRTIGPFLEEKLDFDTNFPHKDYMEPLHDPELRLEWREEMRAEIVAQEVDPGEGRGLKAFQPQVRFVRRLVRGF